MMCRIAIFGALLAVSSPTWSQSRISADDMLRQLVSRGTERAEEQLINQLFSMAPTGVLTREMAETIDQRQSASNRISVMAPVLQNDLDGDAEVSQLEINRVRAVMSGKKRSHFEKMLLKVDTNKDGILSAAEIGAMADETVAKQQANRKRRSLQGASFMVFDSNDDGVVVVDEILQTLRRVAEEGAPVRSNAGIGQSTGCNLPPPSQKAEVVFLGGYEGTAVSNVAVAGLDRETSFATLDIERGENPVYIVVSVHDAMVLRITGATERVERFVGVSRSGIGVVGLPRDRVELATLKECRIPPAHNLDSSNGIKARALLTANLDREVQMAGHYDLGWVKLPSGRSDTSAKPRQASGSLVIHKGNRRFRMTDDGFEEMVASNTPSALQSDLRRYYPDGVATVDPESVVTDGKAEAYDVLPQQAGLIQLMESGALSVLSDGTFSIDKPIARFPAGLNGGHSVRFVLRRGVPMPAGNPGHSRVLIEETGACAGSRC